MALHLWMVRLCIVVVGAYGSSCFMWYHKVVINNLQYPMQQSITRSTNSTSTALAWMPFLISSVSDGSVLGYILSLFVSDRLGRRTMAIVFCVSYLFVASLLLLAMPLENNLILLAVNRVLTGGIYSLSNVNNVAMISECAPTEYRAFFTSLSYLFFGMSSVTANLIASPYVFGNESDWPYALLSGYFPISIALPIMVWSHESPRYSFLVSNNRKQAEQSILFYQGHEKLSSTVADLEYEQSKQTDSRLSLLKILQTPNLRLGATLVAIFGACNTLFGDSILSQLYTPLLQYMGYDYQTAATCTLVSSCIIFATGFLGPIFVHYFNKRRLLLSTSVYCVCSMMILSLLLIVLQRSMERATIALVITITFFSVHSIWVASSAAYRVELLPQSGRTKGINIACLVNSSLSALIAFIFPIVTHGEKLVWLLSTMCFFSAIGVAFQWQKLPDTTNKTFQETQDELLRLIEN